MKCQKCGKALKDDSKLCPECTVADASGNSNKVRQMIFDVIVRQASSLGVPWRQVCLPPMQVNNISAAEIEAELQRRIDGLTKAIDSDPKHAESFVSRGILYNQLGQYQKAIEDYNTAISIDPKQARPYVARGVAFGEQGQWWEAVAEYNEAIKIDSKLVQAYIYRAAAYEQSAMKQLAEKDLRLIEELTGKSFPAKLSGSANGEMPASSSSMPPPAQAIVYTMLSRLRDQTNYSSIIQSATRDLTALLQVDRAIVWTVSDDRLGVVNQFDTTVNKGVAVRSFSPDDSKKIVLEILCRTTSESSVCRRSRCVKGKRIGDALRHVFFALRVFRRGSTPCRSAEIRWHLSGVAGSSAGSAQAVEPGRHRQHENNGRYGGHDCKCQLFGQPAESDGHGADQALPARHRRPRLAPAAACGISKRRNYGLSKNDYAATHRR